MRAKPIIGIFFATLLIYTFLPVACANDREKPDYLYYQALFQTDDNKALKAAIKLDMDYTHILITIPDNPLLKSAQSVIFDGPAKKTLPAKSLKDYKLSLSHQEIEDLVDGLYSLSVTTQHKRIQAPIIPLDEADRPPILNPLDLNHDKTVDKSDWELLLSDISGYYGFIFGKNTNNNQERMPKEEMKKEALKTMRNNPVLLSRYSIHKQIPNYNYIFYKPRQFVKGLQIRTIKGTYNVTDPGNFKGWDVFIPPDDENARTLVTQQWITIGLNRAAQVAIVWQGSEVSPAWLSTWKKTGTVTINGTSRNVFTKKIKADEVTLGSVTDTKNSQPAYLVLLAEENGHPTLPPTIAKGTEEPKPNSLCPKWVHEQYTVKASNGKIYTTWHPQIDPVFWCYFGHEHGADPAKFDKNIKLPFGYAGEAMGMYEAHPGFKVYIWDDKYNYRWLAVQHMGTSTSQAACGRYHELDFMVKKKNSEKILARRFFVGDYGVSYSIVTGKPLTPADCPDQKLIKSRGLRFLPIKGEREDTQEPWIVATNNIIGFTFADFSVTTKDSVRICKDINCNSVELTNNTGTLRSISYVEGLTAWSGFGYSGTFYTDPLGEKRVRKDDPDAVEQYMQPWTTVYSELPQSIHYYNSTDCYDLSGFGAISTCGIDLTAAPAARETAITGPN